MFPRSPFIIVLWSGFNVLLSWLMNSRLSCNLKKQNPTKSVIHILVQCCPISFITWMKHTSNYTACFQWSCVKIPNSVHKARPVVQLAHANWTTSSSKKDPLCDTAIPRCNECLRLLLISVRIKGAQPLAESVFNCRSASTCSEGTVHPFA